MKLTAVFDIRRELAREERRLEGLRLAASSITRRLDGLPHTKPRTSCVEKLAVETATVESRITAMKCTLVETIQELTAAICRRVSGNACEVLVRRYVLSERYADIAAAMHYSIDAVYSLHRQGKCAYFGADDAGKAG